MFTRAIIDGLRTGDADRDRDGRITVTDLYHYVYENVRSVEPRQTPELAWRLASALRRWDICCMRDPYFGLPHGFC